MDNFLFTPKENRTCPECQIGRVQKKSVTYFTWLMDELITVPDFPAWVCDICGRRLYDTRAVTQLSTLLNPIAGKPAGKKKRIRPLADKNTPPPAIP